MKTDRRGFFSLAGLTAGLAQTFTTRELGSMIAAAKLWRDKADLSGIEALPEKERVWLMKLLTHRIR